MSVQITKVHAALRFSKELPGGAWKTVEFGAEATLTEGDTYESARKALYESLAADVRKAFGADGGKPALPAPGEPDENGNAGE
jgi:hypothetical protein